MNFQKTKPLYQEGDWFAIPIEDGEYAVGLIARMKNGRGTKSIFGYFFGPRRNKIPKLDELTELLPEHNIDMCRFGDLGLHEGSWPVIGRFNDWDRSKWPMPPFLRTQLVSGITFKVTYDDTDPGSRISETECDPKEASKYPKDGLSGSGAVEKYLALKLKNSNDGSI